ncbi:MAG: hypothetical protein K9J30_12385 [Bacteroidales bacterium]|nr:hypothetical protein [Bacteroidales bacterium]
MKMKIKYIYRIGAFLLGTVIMFGCVEWPEFESLDLATAPTVTVVQSSSSDSTITVAVTSDAAGFVAAILLEGTGNEVPEDSTALLTGNVEYLDYKYEEAKKADTTISFTFSSDIVQNAGYEVMAVAANSDGVVSPVVVIEVTTTDTYAPGLVGVYPEVTYSRVLNHGDTIILEFDEAVMLGTGKFSFETFYTAQTVDVPADSLLTAGNLVGVILPADFPYNDYVWMHWEADAVADALGNGVSAQTTYFDAENGVFVGYYWRMVSMEFAVQSVAPSVDDDQSAGFDIVLTFGSSASVSDLEDGDITLTYDNGAGMVITVDVPAADVAASGTDVTISQTVFTPTTGGTVTVDVPSGVIGVELGNPNAAYTATWTLIEPS